MVELVRTLIWQIPGLFSGFAIWAEGAKYKASVNASKISLEKLIEREFDTLANIEELDGKPTDFLVNVSGTVDEVRLKALIDQHKLAGRSYAFRIGSIAYSCEFINPVCEDIIELFTVIFNEHMCEDNGVVIIKGYLFQSQSTQWQVYLTSSRPVKSNLNVSGQISGRDVLGTLFFVADFSGTFPSEASEANIDVVIDAAGASYYFIYAPSVVINPISDSFYQYEYQNLS